MNIICGKRASGTLLQMNGRMDAVSAPPFEKEFLQLLDGGRKKVMVDLAGLGTMFTVLATVEEAFAS